MGRYKVDRRKHSVDDRFFDRWTSDMAYVLGWLITDGNVSPTKPVIQWAQACPEPLEKIKVLLKADYPIRAAANRSGHVMHSLAVRSKRLWVSVQWRGVKPRKTGREVFPEVPDECLVDFIRALIEGDGCINIREVKGRKYVRVIFATASEAFTTALADVLRHKWGLGTVRWSQKQAKAKRSLHFVALTGCEALRFLGVLYRDAPPSRYWSVKRQKALEALGCSYACKDKEEERRAIVASMC